MSVPSIHIGKVTVPIVDYAVGAAAVLGIRDSGKTVTSKGIAEQLLDNGIPIIVFDAVGKWRWLKMAGPGANGKGYKVVVAGGRGPDLPLNPHSVPEIVRSALKERIPLVIDLFEKSLSKADWRRIVQTAIRIIHYENEGGAVHVFLEEAAEFVPQRVMDGEVYAEVEKLVRMGGNASVGITLINQRSQEVNKAVLDQCTTLVLGCQVGSKAIEAVGKWVDRLDSDTAEAVTSSLPTLVAGEAWVWTRQNPDKPHREKIPMCRSLHPDRRTPEMVLKTAKATDTVEFVAKMTSAIPKIIEEAKANNPGELKKTIAELRKQLAAKSVAPSPAKTEIKTVEKFVLKDGQIERLEKLASRIQAHNLFTTTKLGEMVKSISETLAMVRQPTQQIRAALPTHRPAPVIHQHRTTEPRPETNGESPAGGLRRMLIALAQRPGLSARQLGVRAGLSSSSGSFNTYLSKGRSSGWLVGGRDCMEATPQGIAAIGHYDPLPEGQGLLDYWLNDLGASGAGRILRALAEAHPNSMSKEDLGAATELSHNSGSFNTYLSKLRTLELIEGSNPLKASDEFFT
jgi:hypothetical protein